MTSGSATGQREFIGTPAVRGMNRVASGSGGRWASSCHGRTGAGRRGARPRGGTGVPGGGVPGGTIGWDGCGSRPCCEGGPCWTGGPGWTGVPGEPGWTGEPGWSGEPGGFCGGGPC
ncbi:hypothetical protein GCM10027258_19090 [Amycolatopsis stemonae]